MYVLGFIGMASIGLIPMRSWSFIHWLRRLNVVAKYKIPLYFAFSIFIATMLWADVATAIRVFRCLSELYCGPGVASGWVYLAMLGTIYIIYESVIFFFPRFLKNNNAPAGKTDLNR